MNCIRKPMRRAARGPSLSVYDGLIHAAVLALLLAAPLGRAAAQPAAPDSRGIAATFIKRLEIMREDSFGGRPLPAENATRNLSRYDAIWAANLIVRGNPAAWKRLKNEHPDTILLYYMSGDTTRAVDDVGYYDYDYINSNHPEWFLVCKKGTDPRQEANRIRVFDDPTSVYYRRFYLDVANERFQSWAVDQIVQRVAEHGYDGLGMDNVQIGWYQLQSFHKRCPQWAYRDDPDEWNRGYLKFMKRVKEALNARGAILVVNQTLHCGSPRDAELWSQLVESVDGAMTERALKYWTDYYRGDEWLLAMERHETLLANGVIDWWTCYPDDQEGFLYTYCSWLLVKEPGKSLYFATRGSPSWDNPRAPWYEEYDLPLGRPTGKRWQRDGYWVRDFEHGEVLVNPGTEERPVGLPDGFRWLDSSTKEFVEKLVLPAQSGRILIAVQ